MLTQFVIEPTGDVPHEVLQHGSPGFETTLDCNLRYIRTASSKCLLIVINRRTISELPQSAMAPAMTPLKSKFQSQTRICRYFGPSSCNHSSPTLPATFADLPQGIRMEIYTLACNPATYNHRYDYPAVILGAIGSRLAVNYIPMKRWEMWSDLRRVSRLVADDRLVWFCLNQLVCLDCTAIASLASEHSPIVRILPYCRHLMIRVDRPCVGYDIEGERGPHTCPAILSPSRWQRLCHHLAKTPSLVLCLEGRFHSLAYAEKIVEGLNRLRLSVLAIGDAGYPNPEMDKLLLLAIQPLVHAEILTRGPFRYLDLPVELRRHILSFTDLVLSPSAAVGWSDGDPPRFWRAPYAPEEEVGCWEKGLCSRKTLVQETHHLSLVQTVYPPCACFQAPKSLFIVCGTMTEDARQVFYSSNCFQLGMSSPPQQLDWKPLDARSVQEQTCPMRRIYLQAFLMKAIPTRYLQHLREIEFCIEDCDYSQIGSEVLQEWSHFLRAWEHHLGRLTLVLHISLPLSEHESAMLQPQPTSAAQFADQVKVVAPLRQLTRLRNFFVFVTVSRMTRNIDVHAVCEQERKLERLVMGDTYNAVDHGKPQHQTFSLDDDGFD